MIPALVIGIVLSVGGLAFVLHPLFFGAARSPAPAPPSREASDGDVAIGALREIEFDRATGKLSDADYAQLKARYTRDAVQAMRAAEAGPGDATRPTDDEVEAAVRAFRLRDGCPTCGPRPEPDAVYCSECGRSLRDRCAGCGAPVEALDARYCVNCGTSLAA